MLAINRCLKTLNPQFQNPSFYLSASLLHNPTSRNPSFRTPAIQLVLNEARVFPPSKPLSNFVAREEEEETFSRNEERAYNVQISHPWPEWADLMEKLLRNGYFDGNGNPFAHGGELGNKDANCIRTACLNFARDQYQLIRCLCRKDISAIVELGCPSTDRKVVNSGKRLRAHVGIDEGNVCSSCILRGDCDRAYVKAREDEGGRTVDVMRILVAYGLDPVVGSVDNGPCLNKRVNESVRTLLKEMVDYSVEGCDLEPVKDTASQSKLSSERHIVDLDKSWVNDQMKQGDWICPKCNFLNFARNFKCLRCDTFCEERVKRASEEQEHLPLKKGDWICNKCKFLNFARNTRCLQCRENPPKRQLNPGEWECDSCNYVNFRRNMVCLKCDHRRPVASNIENMGPQPRTGNLRNHRMHHPRFEEQRSSSPLDQDMGFVDFPMARGKSELSRNLERQQQWRMEMEKKSRTARREADDSRMPGRIEFLATGDNDDDEDDDEISEWFEGGKKP
ncbi:uncharacterized protein LOC127263826 isoform X2 [Andrographis paniculata]|nr:uncharacterized protein LOC127263826 isoform X2 [Andrographis paniculata]XP_051149023.1 uncharacterized protein LOC127263826 isoform X2 [Andrographis paniculata]